MTRDTMRIACLALITTLPVQFLAFGYGTAALVFAGIATTLAVGLAVLV